MTQSEQIPILCGARDAAAMCGVGLSLWYQLNATGQCPMPSKLNSRTLWSCELLRLWAVSGCPHRESEVWQRILRETTACVASGCLNSGRADVKHPLNSGGVQ